MKHNLPIALALRDSPPPYLKGSQIIEKSQKWGTRFSSRNTGSPPYRGLSSYRKARGMNTAS